MPPAPPRQEPAYPVCPECGAARITMAAVTCYRCGRALPAGHSSPSAPEAARQLHPLWLVPGLWYVCAFGISAANVTGTPGLTILLALFAIPPLVTTSRRFAKLAEQGQRFGARDWLMTFLKHLGMVGVAVFLVVGPFYYCIVGYFIHLSPL